jgi:SET domain-containing protein
VTPGGETISGGDAVPMARMLERACFMSGTACENALFTLLIHPMPSAKPPKLYSVRNSAIHGRGVFAADKIRKGTVIIEYKGQRADWDDAMERPDSDPDDPSHTFLFELDDGRVIDARVRGNAARWINHSCDPNCTTFEDDDGRVFIEARRKIPLGEELTYDYRLSVDGKLTKKERKQYTCRCGTKKCRGSLLAKKR